MTNDPGASLYCSASNHASCFYIANPESKRKEWRACGCICHVATF